MTIGTRLLEFFLYCETTLGQFIFSAFINRSSRYVELFTTKYQYLEVVDGKLCYLAKNRPLKYLENEEIDFSNFQTGKPAKIVRNMLSKAGIEQVNDIQFEEFNNCFLSNFDKQPLTFERHRDFAAVYKKSPRKEGTVLSKSCMQKKSEYYFEFYTKIPECSILECTQEGELVGRALIWEVDGETYMDRIYAESPLILEEYYAYAKNNNFFRKWKQDYENTEYWISPEGEPLHKSLSISLNLDSSDAPYVDTFKYYSDKEHRLHTGLGNVSRQFTSTECTYKRIDDHMQPLRATYYCRLTNRWVNPEYLTEIEAGYFKGKKVHQNQITRIDGHCYFKEDPLVRYFYIPGDTEYYYRLIKPGMPLYKNPEGWVMYAEDILIALKKEGKTIYGSKPMHKKLRLIINEPWSFTEDRK